MKIRIPARAQEYLYETQCGYNIRNGELTIDDPETIALFQKVFAAKSRKDGSAWVELDEADLAELHKWMTYLESAVGDNIADGDMSALAELNAARAVMRAIGRVKS